MLSDNLPDVARATLPGTYEGAKKALAQCANLDECKDWKDKAAALASYAKQSKDEELLNLATRIKARAVRRCGELLQEVEPQQGSRTDLELQGGAPPKLTRTAAAEAAGLSDDQRKTALRVASVPAESFEHQVESDKPPTIEALAEQGLTKTSRPQTKRSNPIVRAWDKASTGERTEHIGHLRKIGAGHLPPFDPGPSAASEVERLTARIAALENQKRVAEIKNLALESELEDAAATRAARHEAKKLKRAERERELGAKLIALPDKKYGVIVEDFEWDHETWSEAGKDRHASNHYPTSTDAHTAKEIVKRTKDRFICAAEDCVLFMWSTVQHLAIAIDVLRMRGFDYKSHYVWGKDKVGTGYWSRNKHEVLLIGVRGNIPCPAQGTQWDSLIMAPRGEHSAKPECFLEMIEQYFPNIPKIELNRRGPPRSGWDAWGNEADPPPPPPPAPLVDAAADDPWHIPPDCRCGRAKSAVRP